MPEPVSAPGESDDDSEMAVSRATSAMRSPRLTLFISVEPRYSFDHHATKQGWAPMRRALLACAAVVSLASAAWADEQPSAERLAQALAQQVPPFWAVGDVKVAASVNLGDAVEPRIKQRIEAAATPKADLFIPDTASAGMFGPFLPVIQTLKSGTARTLYGVANSAYRAGEWTVDLVLENPVSSLGTPADLFSQPTLVRGSEEEKTIGERLRADVAAKAKQELEAELARLGVAHASAIGALKVQQQRELEELKASHAARVAEIGGSVETARAEAEAARQEVSRAHEARFAAMQQEHAAAEARVREALERPIQAMRAQQDQELV